ncbi:unnamed protein product [Closterium sp. Naga37s-1]|nr:unnamed protein product [Closterium sp. Naga37s-1]
MCKMTLRVPSFTLLARIHFWVTLDYLARCHLSHLTRFRHKRRHERGVGVSDSLLLRLMLLWPGLEELVLVDKAEEGVGQGRAEEELVLVDKAAEGVGQGGVEEVSAVQCGGVWLNEIHQFGFELTSLTLSLPSLSASKISSEMALMLVASACTSFTHLDLSNFICMSDPPLHEFVLRCPSLAHLSLAGAPISDACLDVIASHFLLPHIFASFSLSPVFSSHPQRCPSLAHLSLAGAPITNASLDLIPYLCPCCPPVYSVISPTPISSAAPRSPISR